MIDKLEIRVPTGTRLMPEVESLFFKVGGRPSRHYLRVHDLRPYGYNAILHHTCLHGKPADIGQQGPRGNHKLELIDTGMMSYEDMLEEIEYVFRTNAKRLSIMRLDLAVDIEGIRPLLNIRTRHCDNWLLPPRTPHLWRGCWRILRSAVFRFEP